MMCGVVCNAGKAGKRQGSPGFLALFLEWLQYATNQSTIFYTVTNDGQPVKTDLLSG
jgi:hypothetical protein